MRVILPGLLILAAVAFYVFSIADWATFERDRVRGLPKGAWIVVIVLVPLIGSALWFLVGRGPEHRAPRPPVRRAQGPDDDPEFLAKLWREREQERRISDLEQRLSDLDRPHNDDDPGSRDA